MNSDLPVPISVDKHPDAKKSKPESSDQKTQTTDESPKQPPQAVLVSAEIKEPDGLEGHSNTQESTAAADDKGSVTKWLWSTPPETKNLIINSLMTIITGVMTFLTLVLAAIGVWQAYIAQAALRETQNSIAVAEKQWQVAKDALDEARKSGEEASKMNKAMLDENRRLSNAAERQAESAKISARASQTSAIVAQDTFRAVERPSLGVEKVELVQFIAGKELRVAVFFKNSGHMPARFATVRSRLVLQKASSISTVCPVIVETELAGLASRSPIPIDGTRVASARSFDPASPVDIQRLENGEWWLLVYVIARYEGAGNKYFTEYYARYNFQNKTFEECGSHNDAN